MNHEPHQINIRERSFKPVTPLVCGHQKCPPNHSCGIEIRRYYLLHYVISGKGIVKVDHKTFNIHAGQMFVLLPNEPFYYKADSEDPWNYEWIGFSGEAGEAFKQNKSRVYSADKQLFDDMQHADEYGNFCEEYLCAKILELLCSLFADQSVKSYESIAKNLVDSRYMQNLSVKFISDQIGINVNYLSFLFKKKYNISLRDYIIQKRMHEAKIFLSRGFNVNEVSGFVGYTDCFSFSRAYKKQYGIPPCTDKNKSLVKLDSFE